MSKVRSRLPPSFSTTVGTYANVQRSLRKTFAREAGFPRGPPPLHATPGRRLARTLLVTAGMNPVLDPTSSTDGVRSRRLLHRAPQAPQAASAVRAAGLPHDPRPRPAHEGVLRRARLPLRGLAPHRFGEAGGRAPLRGV